MYKHCKIHYNMIIFLASHLAIIVVTSVVLYVYIIPLICRWKILLSTLVLMACMASS